MTVFVRHYYKQIQRLLAVEPAMDDPSYPTWLAEHESARRSFNHHRERYFKLRGTPALAAQNALRLEGDALMAALSEAVVLVVNDGDTMEPTLRHGDDLWVDTNETEVTQQDRVWSLSYAGAHAIRRLRRVNSREFDVMADNPHIPPCRISARSLRILGRVKAYGRVL